MSRRHVLLAFALVDLYSRQFGVSFNTVYCAPYSLINPLKEGTVCLFSSVWHFIIRYPLSFMPYRRPLSVSLPCRYLLLPALLGDLTLQQDTGERLDLLHRARVYFVDYLQRCKDYSITEEVSVHKFHAVKHHSISEVSISVLVTWYIKGLKKKLLSDIDISKQ